MKRSRSASRNERPTHARGITLPIKVYPSPELLQRVEDATVKTGLTISRSALICVLLDGWATMHGCPATK